MIKLGICLKNPVLCWETRFSIKVRSITMLSAGFLTIPRRKAPKVYIKLYLYICISISTYIYIQNLYHLHTLLPVYVQTFKVSTVSTLRLLAKVSACPAEAATAARCCALKAPVKEEVEAACDQWLFLVPLIGGRWHIITQLANCIKDSRDSFI